MNKIIKYGCIVQCILTLAFFIIWFLIVVLHLDKSSNRDIITRIESQYVHYEYELNDIAKGCSSLNTSDTISIFYSEAKDEFHIETKYEYILREMPFLRRNISVLKGYFRTICFCDLYVEFYGTSRNMNYNYCSLIWCPEVYKLCPRYQIYPYGQYPDDSEQNCLYHLEGDWYICLP